MEIERNFFESANSNGKDLLLRKCRDTIQVLESSLGNQLKIQSDLEKKIKDMSMIQENLQDDLEEKSFLLKTLKSSHYELETKYQILLKKTSKLEEENEKLQKKMQDYETEIFHKNEYIEEVENERKSKDLLIKDWNDAMTAVEQKINILNQEKIILAQDAENYYSRYEDVMKENRHFSRLWGEISNKNEDLLKEMMDLKSERESLLKKIAENKENLSFQSFELENKSKQLKEVLELIEESKKNQKTSEKSVEDLNFKLASLKEEAYCYKIRSENFEKLIKESEIKYQTEIQGLKQLYDEKNLSWSKEDIKKNKKISELEHEINNYKDEIEKLISANASLQTRHREILNKYSSKKNELSEKVLENNKLSIALNKFDEKLKSLESTSIKDITSLKQEKIQQSTIHSEELKNKTKEYESKIENILKEHSKKIEENSHKYELEIGKLRNEIISLKEDYKNTVIYKDEEIHVLNEDRNKLQSALGELESKIFEISKNLENSVSDCWKLSSELQKSKDLQKEEILKISQYYRDQLMIKEEENLLQHEKYSERLKDKFKNEHERILGFKESLRKEIGSIGSFLEYIDPNSKEELKSIIERAQKIINNY